MTRASCDAWHPSAPAFNDECKEGRSDCTLGGACCPVGQALECGDIVSTNDFLPTDVRVPGYRNCPTGMRVGIFKNDAGGDSAVWCRQGCRCVVPCGTRPGTTRTCSRTRLGTYTRTTNDGNIRSCNFSNYQLDDDDRWISTTPKRCYQEWQEVIECDEEGDRCRKRRRLVTVCEYTVTCERMATVCTCSQSCNSTAPTNLNVVQGASATAATLSWRSGTGGTSQIIYVGTNENSVNNNCASGGCIISGAQLTPFYANSNFSYPVTGLTANTTYYFRVVTHENASCRPSATVPYTVPNLTLSGRVYLDANNDCSTATPWNLGGLTVSVRGSAYSGTVGADGRFGFYGGVKFSKTSPPHLPGFFHPGLPTAGEPPTAAIHEFCEVIL